MYRATYHAPQDYYNGQNTLSTGAVPRSWHSDQKIVPRQHAQSEELTNNNSQSVTVQIETAKESNPKEANKNSKTMTKTYHTIKDIISSRFKSSKDNDDKVEESGLNNTEDTRKSIRNVEEHEKKTVGEQGIYGKPRTDQNMTLQQHQYNQHIIQQHMIAQQAMQAQQQYHQASQQYKTQQQLTQARSQEMLAPKPDEQIYYQNAYGSAPQRPQNRYGIQTPHRDSNYVAMHHSPVSQNSFWW